MTVLPPIWHLNVYTLSASDDQCLTTSYQWGRTRLCTRARRALIMMQSPTRGNENLRSKRRAVYTSPRAYQPQARLPSLQNPIEAACDRPRSYRPFQLRKIESCVHGLVYRLHASPKGPAEALPDTRSIVVQGVEGRMNNGSQYLAAIRLLVTRKV